MKSFLVGQINKWYSITLNGIPKNKTIHSICRTGTTWARGCNRETTMTPVAPLATLRAATWEDALEETLSSATHDGFGGDLIVHSVHDHVVNVQCFGGLIALAHDRLDDAPWTIRIPASGWTTLRAQAGDRVEVEGVPGDGHALVVHSVAGSVRIMLNAADRWTPVVDARTPSTTALRAARTALDAFTSPAAITPFGAASAQALDAGVERLRAAAMALLHGAATAESVTALIAEPIAQPVTEAARRLLGLGEGLTPSGDDILTGLAFLAAHPGFGLTAILEPVTAAVHDGDDSTTLLSLVTLRAALTGRARRRLHDLVTALIVGDNPRIVTMATETAAIGHTSGCDILTGIRLALDLAETARTRAPIPTATPQIAPPQGEFS